MIATALTTLVALSHAGFLWLEAVAWTWPLGRRVFGTSADFAEQSRALAANQGLYNGFLAAGLGFALWRGDAIWQAFLLGCVVVAGLFGAATVSRRILFVQALPAGLALAALALGL